MCSDCSTLFTPGAGLLEGAGRRRCVGGGSHLKLNLGFLLGDLQDLGGVVRAPQAFLLHEHLARTAGHEPTELVHTIVQVAVGQYSRAAAPL